VPRHRALALLVLGACTLVAACGWDPSRPFERNAPAVDQAIRALDAGDATAAAQLLTDYLSTGACDKGTIGTPELVRKRPNGAIDLGLSLFAIAEAYGGRFGEEADGGTQEERAARIEHVLCALRIVQSVAEDETQAIETRARARALEGNLQFLAEQYEGAVEAYDKALALTPGREEPKEGGAEVHPLDALGRDVAWNRAIALRRIEDKKQDAGSDGGADGGNDGGGDGGDGGQDGGDSGRGGDGGGDSGAGSDGGDGGDSGGGGGGDGSRDAGSPDAGQDGGDGANRPEGGAPPPPPSRSDRVLDQLERAPTVQQEVARKAARVQRVQGAADK
jgi:hypothetical protein